MSLPQVQGVYITPPGNQTTNIEAKVSVFMY